MVAFKVELTVTPAHVSDDTLVDICGAVHNLGSSKINTEIWASILLVNGEPCENWSWAIANGLRDEKEFVLLPGERVEFRRTFPSSSIFPGSGRYEMVLKVRGVQSAEVIVERY